MHKRECEVMQRLRDWNQDPLLNSPTEELEYGSSEEYDSHAGVSNEHSEYSSSDEDSFVEP